MAFLRQKRRQTSGDSEPLTLKGGSLRFARYAHLASFVSTVVELKRNLELICELPPSEAHTYLHGLRASAHDTFNRSRRGKCGEYCEDEKRFLAAVDGVIDDLLRKNLVVQRYQARPSLVEQAFQKFGLRAPALGKISFRAFSIVLELSGRSYRRAGGQSSVGMYKNDTPFVLIDAAWHGKDKEELTDTLRHEEIHDVLDTLDKVLRRRDFDRFDTFIIRSTQDAARAKKGSSTFSLEARWEGVLASDVMNAQHSELVAEVPNGVKKSFFKRGYVITPASFDELYHLSIDVLDRALPSSCEELRSGLQRKAARLHHTLAKAYITARQLGVAAVDQVEALLVLLPPMRYSQLYGWLKFLHGRERVRKIWEAIPVLGEKLTDLSALRTCARLSEKLIEEDRARLQDAFASLASTPQLQPSDLGIRSLRELYRYRKLLRQIPIERDTAIAVRRKLLMSYFFPSCR